MNTSERANEIEIANIFPEKRKIDTKIYFDYDESKDETLLYEEENLSKISF